MRFYGLPSGYEFGSLVDAILDVSPATSGLVGRDADARSPRSTRDVHLRVFSTPT